MALDAVRRPLFTLVYSVEKHLADGDLVRLRWRISWTLEKLAEAACDLRDKGYDKAAEFLEARARTCQRLIFNKVNNLKKI